MSCDGRTTDPELLSTYWRCMPPPEQQALHNMAQLYIANVPGITYDTLSNYFVVTGGVPVETRVEVFLEGMRIFTVPEPAPDCTEENPCIVFALSPFILELAGNITNPFYALNAERCRPCYFSLAFGIIA